MEQIEILLNNREQRAHYQNELLNKFQKTLVVVKANYPGSEKNNVLTSYVVTKKYLKIKEVLDIEQYFVTSSAEGLIYYLICNDDFYDTKIKMIEIENNALGRLVDIDVYFKDKQLSRNDLNIEARKCFICNEHAKVCSRSQKHSYDEIINYFEKVVYNDIFKEYLYSNLALYGLINELNKPYNCGCVGINSTGIHQDMDYHTFIDSIEIIFNAFKDFNKIETTEFNELRKFGVKVEEEMFLVTKGINTYKGAIFSLILLFAAIENTKFYKDISNEIKRLSVNIFADFTDTTMMNSFGQQLYKENKNAGIRELAFNGYNEVFEVYEPYYSKTNDINATFIYIISKLNDTTIIKRGGMKKLVDLHNKAEVVLESKEYDVIDKYCLNNNLSCGGSADILALTLICNLVRNNYSLI